VSFVFGFIQIQFLLRKFVHSCNATVGEVGPMGQTAAVLCSTLWLPVVDCPTVGVCFCHAAMQSSDRIGIYDMRAEWNGEKGRE
jgi:hypothetical protein